MNQEKLAKLQAQVRIGGKVHSFTFNYHCDIHLHFRFIGPPGAFRSTRFVRWVQVYVVKRSPYNMSIKPDMAILNLTLKSHIIPVKTLDEMILC